MEVQIWLSEQDEVVVNPGDLTLMTEQGAVVFMGDAEERMAWLEKVAEAMECEVKPMTPEYHGPTFEEYIASAPPASTDLPPLAEYIPKDVATELFAILREDQTIHWMGKPRD